MVLAHWNVWFCWLRTLLRLQEHATRCKSHAESCNTCNMLNCEVESCLLTKWIESESDHESQVLEFFLNRHILQTYMIVYVYRIQVSKIYTRTILAQPPRHNCICRLDFTDLQNRAARMPPMFLDFLDTTIDFDWLKYPLLREGTTPKTLCLLSSSTAAAAQHL